MKSQQDRFLVSWRSKRFLSLLHELESLGLGFNQHVFTSESNISEEQINQITKNLLHNFKADEKTVSCYYSLIYCTLRVLSTSFLCNGIDIGCTPQSISYADILDLLKPDTVEEPSGIVCYPIGSTLSLIMQELYTLLSSNKLPEHHILVPRNYYNDPDYVPITAEEEAAMHQQEYASMTQEEIESDLKELQRNTEEERLQNIYVKNTFTNSEVYCSQFENMVTDRTTNLCDWSNLTMLRESFIQYLLESGNSICTEEDAFITACACIKKTKKMISNR